MRSLINLVSDVIASIDAILYEDAEIDGAFNRQKFRNITVR